MKQVKSYTTLFPRVCGNPATPPTDFSRSLLKQSDTRLAYDYKRAKSYDENVSKIPVRMGFYFLTVL
jgi:hypothetical protein